MAKTKRINNFHKPKNTTKEKKQLKKQILKNQISSFKKQTTLKNNSVSNLEEKNKIFKPPFQILLDTNFILHCIKKHINLSNLTTSTFLSNVTLNIPSCVFAELEKLNEFVAIKVLKQTSHNVLECSHKGNYADDCIFNRALIHKSYIVASSDRALRSRLRNINRPIVYIRGFKFIVEGMYY